MSTGLHREVLPAKPAPDPLSKYPLFYWWMAVVLALVSFVVTSTLADLW